MITPAILKELKIEPTNIVGNSEAVFPDEVDMLQRALFTALQIVERDQPDSLRATAFTLFKCIRDSEKLLDGNELIVFSEIIGYFPDFNTNIPLHKAAEQIEDDIPF